MHGGVLCPRPPALSKFLPHNRHKGILFGGKYADWLGLTNMANHTRPISTQLGHEKRYATCGIFLRMDRDAFPYELSLAQRLHKQRTLFQSCGGLVGGCSNIPAAKA